MIFRLSRKNVKKSMQEYLIYFLTITVTVALSYVFNLLPYQPFMSAFTEEVAQEMSHLLTGLILPVTLIVAGLIAYSNMFLLKRRSREVGIYMMLGMRYSHVHLLMLYETFLISLVSFVVGVAIGMLSSRGFDLMITNLLGLTIEQGSIVFTLPAFLKTLTSFAVIFIFVTILNYFSISRAKLINIVSASGEKHIKTQGKRNIILNSIVFLFSVFGLIVFYNALMTQSLDFNNIKVTISIFIGLLGHVGIFVSGSGILAYLVSKNKKLLYKGINLFTLKQITAKIRVNGFILSIISFMMASTLVLLCLGISNRVWVDASLQEKAPYSISISGLETKVENESIENFVKEKGYTITESLSFPVYYTDYVWKDIMDYTKVDMLDDSYEYQTMNSIKVISLTDYNNLRELQGLEKVDLIENQYLIHTRNEFKNTIILNKEVNIGGKVLVPAEHMIYTEPIGDGKYLIGGDITCVVADNVVSQNDYYTKSLVINLKENNTYDLNHKLYKFIGETSGGHFVVTRSDVKAFNLKQASIVIFTGLFLGTILLISGSTILSLQQMTEVIENKRRYALISKLGVGEKQINKSVRKQILSYFEIPFITALIHSILGTVIISKYIVLSNGLKIISIGLSLLVFIIIYVVYIIFTYLNCKKIVEQQY